MFCKRYTTCTTAGNRWVGQLDRNHDRTFFCDRDCIRWPGDGGCPGKPVNDPFLFFNGDYFTDRYHTLSFVLTGYRGDESSSRRKLEKSIWSFRHLKLGVIAIFFYVGVEVCIGANINLYAIEQENLHGSFSFLGNHSLSVFGINFAIPALMATLYWGGMLIGRLVGSSLSRISPRIQLTVTTVSATVLTLLAILLNNPWLLTAVGLFHSIMWGAIFTLSVNKLGKYTSIASGVFMIGVVGGAILPLVQGMVADLLGGWRWSWLLVIFGELFMLYYALIGSKVKE